MGALVVALIEQMRKRSAPKKRPRGEARCQRWRSVGKVTRESARTMSAAISATPTPPAIRTTYSPNPLAHSLICQYYTKSADIAGDLFHHGFTRIFTDGVGCFLTQRHEGTESQRSGGRQAAIIFIDGGQGTARPTNISRFSRSPRQKQSVPIRENPWLKTAAPKVFASPLRQNLCELCVKQTQGTAHPTFCAFQFTATAEWVAWRRRVVEMEVRGRPVRLARAAR